MNANARVSPQRRSWRRSASGRTLRKPPPFAGQTAEQKAADDLKAAQDAQNAAEQKAADLEAIIAAVKAGVPADAAEDVVALAKLKVSETVPLSAAIAEVLKKYPQFSGAPAPVTTTGTKINNGGGTNVSGVEKIFLERNPGIKI